MQYKIIVDKQSSVNPSTEKKEYIIDIEELRVKGDVYDTLVITKDEDYVMRRLSLSEYHVLSVLEEPVKEPLQDINIELFEGDNYIYIQDMTGNKFYVEYLIKNDFTDTYVTVNQMNSAITQSAGEIELNVNQKFTKYSTTEEMNSAITAKANEINLEVNKKVNEKDLTGANIALRINNDESEVQINADKININGAISANGNFKVDTDGKMECTNAYFTGGNVDLIGSSGSKAFRYFADSSKETSKMAYITGNTFAINNENDRAEIYCAGEVGPRLDLSRTGVSLTTVCYDGITTPLVTQTSRAESKKNFEKLKNGLDILKKVDIYKYNLKSEEDKKKKHIGFVIGENYKYSHEITAEDDEGKEIGVDTYSMVSVLWKAVQELTEKVERLEGTNGQS